MTAKQYLGELKRMDVLVRQKLEEIAMLEEQATCIPALNIKPDIIQTSPDGEGFTKLIDKAAQLRAELEKDIDRLNNERRIRVDQIQQLDNPLFVEILFRRYVLFESLEDVAAHCHLSYDRVRHYHGDALQKFSQKVKVDTK